MIRNYLKIAWRNLLRHKMFSVINIISLAIGFSASFVIGLMVYHDLTFDKFHEDADLIYRVTTRFETPDGTFNNSGVTVPLKTAAKERMSGIDVASSMYLAYVMSVENPDIKNKFKNPEHITYSDADYFDIFKYNWLAGSRHQVFKNPNEVVLTDARASKYFPDTAFDEVVGKTLVYNDSVLVNVVGVVQNFRERSDFKFQEFLSEETAKQLDGSNTQVLEQQWDNTNSASQLFLKLEPDTKLTDIQAQLNVLAEDNRSEFQIKYGQKRLFSLQSLNDMHFSEDMGIFNFTEYSASKRILWGLAAIALFILLLGIINFINLTTAQSNQRSKEIGIRKTLGSSKKQIISQFMGETFLLTLISAIVSIGLAYFLLKAFSDFTPEGLVFSTFKEPWILALSVLLVVIVTILAGIYPSLILTRFKPISVIKNQQGSVNGKPNLRRFLTVFQFAIAQVFIISTILVGKQIKFMMNKDMGIDTESVVYINTPWNANTLDKVTRLGQTYVQMPQVSEVSLASNPPASFSTNTNISTFFRDDIEVQVPLQMLFGDTNYANLYDMKLLAGRDRLNDTIKELVVNEAYVKALGFESPSEAISKQVNLSDEAYSIVGVVKDFNQRSLKEGIEPMGILGDLNRDRFFRFKTIHLRLNASEGDELSETLARLESDYKMVYPDSDFQLNFMDETIERFYKQERSFSKLLNWAMGLSVLISCLGLLGLVIYTTERRTKEIGIRKVLGATLAQLNVLLCKDFLILVLIAFVIAAPLAWWGMSNWLQDFAFKTNLSWWIFAASGMGMIAIALLIMSLKTVSTALKNPVNSLRTE